MMGNHNMFTWPNSLAYRLWAVSLWSLFLLDLIALSWARRVGLPAPILWTLAAFPGASVLLQFYLAYRLVSRQDEFVRALTAKRMIAAGGLTIALATGWSVAEQFVAAPNVPLWLMYPFFWSAFAAVTPLIRDSEP
jgi:hypothetical protein